MVSANTWSLLMIAVGILLLVSPAAVLSLGIGEPTYEYESFELDLEADDFGVPATMFPGQFYLDEVVCLDHTRSCLLEQHVFEQGEIPVESTSFRRAPYDYAYLNGSFYRTEEVERDGQMYLTHESASAAEAFRYSGSVAYRHAAPELREAVDAGYVETPTNLDTPRVVVENADMGEERYHYVYTTDRPAGNEHGPNLGDRLLTVGLAATGFLIGLWSVLRGYRRRVLRR